MAGTLTISTLSDGTNSTSSTNCIQGSAKAWVNYDGVAYSTRASYNVSSVTRNGAGDYTINFSSALSDNKYCVTGCTMGGSSNGLVLTVLGTYNSSTGMTLMSSSQVRVVSNNMNGSYDNGLICLTVFR